MWLGATALLSTFRCVIGRRVRLVTVILKFWTLRWKMPVPSTIWAWRREWRRCCTEPRIMFWTVRSCFTASKAAIGLCRVVWGRFFRVTPFFRAVERRFLFEKEERKSFCLLSGKVGPGLWCNTSSCLKPMHAAGWLLNRRL